MNNENKRSNEPIFKVLTDLLVEFIRVCEKYDINYFVDSGTLLGTIRHKGFIPWDDDIDIVLVRKDYEKLKEVAKEEFIFPFFFQTPSTDMGYPKGFARLRNSVTTSIPYQDVSMACNRGIFIDIFPLDIIPDNEKLFKQQVKQLRNLRLVMNAYSRFNSKFNTIGTTKVKALLFWFFYPFFKINLINNDKLFKRFAELYNEPVHLE